MTRWLVTPTLLLTLALGARADVLLGYPQDPGGVLIKSSWVPPDGSDSDEYAWESFPLKGASTITQIQWQGGAPVNEYTITLSATPVLPESPNVIARYVIAGNAGATPIGMVNGTMRYDYHLVLPTPLQISGGVWINIEGSNYWAISQGSGGNGLHVTFYAGGPYFLNAQGDLAITLLGPCSADCDQNGLLAIDDFICFQTMFALGDPAADCDVSGTLTIDDFICFQTLFALGC